MTDQQLIFAPGRSKLREMEKFESARGEPAIAYETYEAFEILNDCPTLLFEINIPMNPHIRSMQSRLEYPRFFISRKITVGY